MFSCACFFFFFCLLGLLLKLSNEPSVYPVQMMSNNPKTLYQCSYANSLQEQEQKTGHKLREWDKAMQKHLWKIQIKMCFCPDLDSICFTPTNFPILSGSCRIGGAVPIVFSFFAEVLSREKRGEHLSWLCMFWMIGEIYASAMAWAIIPHYGESIS